MLNQADFEDLKFGRSGNILLAIERLEMFWRVLDRDIPGWGSETLRGRVLLLFARLEFGFSKLIALRLGTELSDDFVRQFDRWSFTKKQELVQKMGLFESDYLDAVEGFRLLRNEYAHRMKSPSPDFCEKIQVKKFRNFIHVPN